MSGGIKLENSLALDDEIAFATRFAQRNVSMDRPGSSFHFLLVFLVRDLASAFCWLKQNGLLFWFDFFF